MSCTWTRFSKERGVKNCSRTCEKLDGFGMAATWVWHGCNLALSKFCICLFCFLRMVLLFPCWHNRWSRCRFHFCNISHSPRRKGWLCHFPFLQPHLNTAHNQPSLCMHVRILSLASSFNLKTTVHYCHDFKDIKHNLSYQGVNIPIYPPIVNLLLIVWITCVVHIIMLWILSKGKLDISFIVFTTKKKIQRKELCI